MKDKLTKFELDEENFVMIAGGNPLLAFLSPVGYALTYVAVVDLAMKVGEGLGEGFYDATHS